jgi:hypothetical protein
MMQKWKGTVLVLMGSTVTVAGSRWHRFDKIIKLKSMRQIQNIETDRLDVVECMIPYQKVWRVELLKIRAQMGAILDPVLKIFWIGTGSGDWFRVVQIHFHGVEKAIATQFLPVLFGESLATDDIDSRRLLACLPVKHAGIAIADPTATSDVFYEASTLHCSHLMAAVRGVEKFKHSTHMAIRKDTIAELQNHKIQRHDKELSSILAPLPCHTI